MHYHATHGRHKTQTHVLNAHTVCEKCKSRELITDFNKQCMCISYKSIKPQWSNLAKSTVLQSLPVAVPLPSHFDTQSFTIAALDNSHSADRNSLSRRTMSFTDILTIKNLKKIKWQEILSFH